MIELSNNWYLQQVGTEHWLPASVPGCVHTDLLNNNIITDPFYSVNVNHLQWIEQNDWRYKTNFEIGSNILNCETVELKFAGIDTFADIYLNGTLLDKTNNMFTSYTLDCKKLLHEGSNELLLYIHSATKFGQELIGKRPLELPANTEKYHVKESPYIRKAPYMFGWDASPRLITSGIWRPVFLLAWNKAKIERIRITQDSLSFRSASLTAYYTIISTGKYEGKIRVIHKGKKIAEKKISLKKGTNTLELEFDLQKYKLWWPNGLGEQILYNFNFVLEVDNQKIDEWQDRIGLRTIELVVKEDKHGQPFYFKVNSKPIFMKGANWTPLDSFPARISREKYEKMLNDAADCNINMLRVWAGGFYEDDLFYQLCDEKGILVWQDFMFSNTMYPANEEFIETVRKEAECNIIRLRNHPCLALWCGNNEVKEGWRTKGWQENRSEKEKVELGMDYERIFFNILPEAIKKYDVDRPYWHSSPSNEKFDEPSLNAGDFHYWKILKGDMIQHFKTNVGRFMSEFGFKGFPEIKTLRTFAKESDFQMFSEVFDLHQGWEEGISIILANMIHLYREPKDFKMFVYVSQLLQAEAIKTAIEAHRRRKNYCMGSLYMQFADCWPSISWSGIDYFGRWKAMQYFVKQSFKQVLISPIIKDGMVQVHILNDNIDDVEAKVELFLSDFNGTELKKIHFESILKANSAKIVHEMPESTLLGRFDRREVLLQVKVSDQEKTLSENILYFTSPKFLNLHTPNITKRITSFSKGYNIELNTNCLAKNVYLYIDEDGFFTENFFDLIPGMPLKFSFLCRDKIESFSDKIQINSLFDTF